MQRAAIVITLILAMLLPAAPAQAHTMTGSHSAICEGWLWNDHNIISDGGGWYHDLTRYANVNEQWTAVKNHYQWHPTGGYLYRHRTVSNSCGPVFPI
jgi:hypothetical protein